MKPSGTFLVCFALMTLLMNLWGQGAPSPNPEPATSGGLRLASPVSGSSIPPSQASRNRRNAFLTVGIAAAGVTGACLLTGALIDGDATARQGAYQSSSSTPDATALGDAITAQIGTANGFFVAAESGLLLTVTFGVLTLVEHLRGQKLARAERERMQFVAFVLPNRVQVGMGLRF